MTEILQTIKRNLLKGCKDFAVERWMLTEKDQPLLDHGVFSFNGKFSDRYPCPNCEAPFQFTLKDGMYYGVCMSCATLGEDAWPPSQVELMDFSYRKFILFIHNPTVIGEYVEEAAKCLTDDLAKADSLEEEVLASCETPEELLRYLAGKDARSEVAHLIRIGLLFKENWFFIVTEDGEADGKPDGWHYFESLEQTLNHEIAKLAKGEVKAPCSCGEWQRILPEALTFPYDEAIYYEAADDDDDPAVAEYTLLGNRKVRVGWEYRPHSLAPYIDKVRELMPNYLTAALKFAQSINSKSSDMWADALGCYKRVNHAFTMPQSRPLLDRMAQSMIDAVTRLEIDVSLLPSEKGKTPKGTKTPDPKRELSHTFKMRIDEANAKIAERLRQTFKQMTAGDRFTTEEVGAFMRMGVAEVQGLLEGELMPILLEATKALDDEIIDEVDDYDESEPWCVLEDICETWLTRIGQEQFIPNAKEKIEELSRSLACGKMWYDIDLGKEYRVPDQFLEVWNMIAPENLKESTSGSGGGKSKDKLRGQREKAHSAVVAYGASKYIYVEDGTSIKVFTPDGTETFKFTRASEWEVVNRFLLSLQKGDDNRNDYPVPFTCQDNNKCKGECDAFLRRFTEWEPLKPGSKHHKPWARFKVELLGERKYKEHPYRQR